MLKKNIILAIASGFGCALGYVLQRLLLPGAYGPSYPSIWVVALVAFAVSSLASFAVFTLIELVRKRKR